jgi:hypothetical protein
VSTAAGVGASVIDGEADERIEVAAPSRRAGERAEMNDADEELAGRVKERIHAGKKGKGLL